MGLLRKIFLTETTEPLTQVQGARRSLALQKREVGSVLSESGEDCQLSRNGICFEWGEIHSSWEMTVKLTFPPSIRAELWPSERTKDLKKQQENNQQLPPRKLGGCTFSDHPSFSPCPPPFPLPGSCMSGKCSTLAQHP